MYEIQVVGIIFNTATFLFHDGTSTVMNMRFIYFLVQTVVSLPKTD